MHKRVVIVSSVAFTVAVGVFYWFERRRQRSIESQTRKRIKSEVAEIYQLYRSKLATLEANNALINVNMATLEANNALIDAQNETIKRLEMYLRDIYYHYYYYHLEIMESINEYNNGPTESSDDHHVKPGYDQNAVYFKRICNNLAEIKSMVLNLCHRYREEDNISSLSEESVQQIRTRYSILEETESQVSDVSDASEAITEESTEPIRAPVLHEEEADLQLAVQNTESNTTPEERVQSTKSVPESSTALEKQNFVSHTAGDRLEPDKSAPETKPILHEENAIQKNTNTTEYRTGCVETVPEMNISSLSEEFVRQTRDTRETESQVSDVNDASEAITEESRETIRALILHKEKADLQLAVKSTELNITPEEDAELNKFERNAHN